MVRFCTMSGVATFALLLAATGAAGTFASSVLLIGAVTLFGLAIGLCNARLSQN